MNTEEARRALERQGYRVKDLKMVQPGRGRNAVFEVELGSGTLIAKFDEGLKGDPQYDSPVSLEREAGIMNTVLEAGLPVPAILDFYDGGYSSFMLLEKPEGKTFAEFLESEGHSLDSYLKSLEYLGEDIGKAHKVKFDYFGSLFPLSTGVMISPHFDGFIGWLEHAFDVKFRELSKSGALTGDELVRLEEAVYTKIGELENIYEPSQPGLVLGNVHPGSVLVDGEGKPVSYGGLEFSQSNIAPLDFSGIETTMLAYYDDSLDEAWDAFLKGYGRQGGEYDRDGGAERRVRELLFIRGCIPQILYYQGVKDGIRDDWSRQYKELLMETIGGEGYDPVAANRIQRTKTGQPAAARNG